MGLWTGGPEGEVYRLRLPYRPMLGEQGVSVISAHVSKFVLETAATAHVLHPANTECPSVRVGDAMHHGLRDKECPRCGRRGWIKARPSGRLGVTMPGSSGLQMPVPEWSEWPGRTHRELMVRCGGSSCRARKGLGVSLTITSHRPPGTNAMQQF